MHIVVIMDPPTKVNATEDTSFALMLQAQTQGHRVDHCLQTDIFLRGAALHARVRRACCDRASTPPISLGAPEDIELASVDAILIRTDPPFDTAYHYTTLLLEHVRDEVLIINDPKGLREANEKLYAMHFADCMPETLVTNDGARIKRFVDELGGRAVLKPLDGAGGEGIFSLRTDDSNLNAILENTTRHGTELAMVQAYLPEVKVGDKRILLLNGEPLGAILRVPQGGDLRSNIHVGGRVERATLDAEDKRIIATVAPRLRADGLVFVGLDVIGGKLTEINVTSPTGIQQMSRLDGVSYEAEVIAWIEKYAQN